MGESIEFVGGPMDGLVAHYEPPFHSRVYYRNRHRVPAALPTEPRLADELGVPLLGQVPLQAQMADLADAGKPIVAAELSSPAAQALDAIAQRVVEQLAGGPGSELPIVAR